MWPYSGAEQGFEILEGQIEKKKIGGRGKT
jgi:hypothetical protein